MFGSSPKNAANAYSKIGMETGVFAADPHKLIVMLFDGAVKAICNASIYMRDGKIPDKGRSITHAISIIESGLRASLNKEVGGELARNLDALYGYMARQLLLANIHNDQKILDEVKKQLLELKDAWEQIAPAKQDKQAEAVQAPTPPKAPRDALAPRKSGYTSA
jgi:flagellar secretion chaperone FliS